MDFKVKVEQFIGGLYPIEGKTPEKTFYRGTSILEELGIPFWLDAGTLLGLYREQRLIPHDTDIDVSIKQVHYTDKIPQTFLGRKFKLCRRVTGHGGVIQLAFMDGLNHDVIFDMEFWQPLDDYYVRPNEYGYLRTPKSFIDGMVKHKFVLGEYYAPTPVKEFLIYRYGEDWNTSRNVKHPWHEYTKNQIDL